MGRYNLSPNELFIIRLLLLAKSEATMHYLSDFLQIDKYNKTMVRDCLYSLQEKGVILQSYIIPEEGKTFYPSEVLFSKNFDKNFEKASQDMGRELFSVYPTLAVINGMTVPIKTISRHFNSLEDAFRSYGKAIKYNKELHNHILELVKWASENTGILNCSLSSFIINEFWTVLEEIKDGNRSNINFEETRLL